MDAVFLARLQFAMTVGFHYIFPVITIGLAWLIFILLTLHRRTQDPDYLRLGRYWIKLFAITFVMGVATGITMEFQFGTNWAHYSRFVGDIFGAPLAAEGILAFFLESSFLAILLYGYEKVSARTYWLSSLLVAFGTTLSAFWIIVANSWQQMPVGHIVRNGRAEMVDFWAVVFSKAAIPAYLHAVNGALIAGAFFMMGLSAYHLLKREHERLAQKALVVSLVMAFWSSLALLPIGHAQAVRVGQTQPIKLAAFEGLWETTDRAPLLLFGVPNTQSERTDFAVGVPSLLSVLMGNSPTHVVPGLKSVPVEERPPVGMTFYSFHIMVGLGFYFMAITAWGLYLKRKGRLFSSRCFLQLLLISIPLPVIANQLGWCAAEVGRQPWIVQGLLRTRDAISVSVSAQAILISMILMGLIYLFLFCAWIYLLRKKVMHAPELSE